MDIPDKMTLVNLAKGAAVELFGHELVKVLKNIGDVNTDAEAPREITIKVKFRPDADRSMADVAIAVTSKLAAAETVRTKTFMGRDAGQFIAREHNPDQLSFDMEKPVAIDGGKSEVNDGR